MNKLKIMIMLKKIRILTKKFIRHALRLIYKIIIYSELIFVRYGTSLVSIITYLIATYYLTGTVYAESPDPDAGYNSNSGHVNSDSDNDNANSGNDANSDLEEDQKVTRGPSEKALGKRKWIEPEPKPEYNSSEESDNDSYEKQLQKAMELSKKEHQTSQYHSSAQHYSSTHAESSKVAAQQDSGSEYSVESTDEERDAKLLQEQKNRAKNLGMDFEDYKERQVGKNNLSELIKQERTALIYRNVRTRVETSEEIQRKFAEYLEELLRKLKEEGKKK